MITRRDSALEWLRQSKKMLLYRPRSCFTAPFRFDSREMVPDET